ncbi:hypothetical protein X975_08787, partial [Stegodyphus mimosarum]
MSSMTLHLPCPLCDVIGHARSSSLLLPQNSPSYTTDVHFFPKKKRNEIHSASEEEGESGHVV